MRQLAVKVRELMTRLIQCPELDCAVVRCYKPVPSCVEEADISTVLVLDVGSLLGALAAAF